MGTATSDILNLPDLLSRVDNDRELLVELFFIFKTVFPVHLQNLSQAIEREEAKQVETESHTLRGMLLNLSALRAAAVAAELEQLGRANQIADMKEALTRFQSETEALSLQIDECVPEFQP